MLKLGTHFVSLTATVTHGFHFFSQTRHIHIFSIKMTDARQHEHYFKSLKQMAEILPYEDWSKFTINLANARLLQLELTWESLLVLNMEYELQNGGPDAAGGNSSLFQTARQFYVESKTVMQQYIARLNTIIKCQQSALSFESDKQQLLLKIGTFDGDFAKWCDFRDRFTVEVHFNEALESDQKLMVLKSVVSNRAAQVLGRWQSTDDNYGLIWDNLCTFYNKQYENVTSHIRSLQSMSRFKATTFDGIFKLIDTVVQAHRGLIENEVSADKWDLLVVHLIQKRLDDRSRDAWTRYCESKQILLPTWNEMQEFLQRYGVERTLAKPHDADQSTSSMRCSMKSEFVASSAPINKRDSQLNGNREIRRRDRRTGENKINYGECIVCGRKQHVRYTNCKGCTARGHERCLERENLFSDTNDRRNWKCPNCLERGSPTTSAFGGIRH